MLEEIVEEWEWLEFDTTLFYSKLIFLVIFTYDSFYAHFYGKLL